MIGASYEMFLSCRSFVMAIAVTSLLQLAMCMRTSGFQPSPPSSGSFAQFHSSV